MSESDVEKMGELMARDQSEVSVDLGVMQKIAEIIKRNGETEYKYYAIPIRWNSRAKSHIRQITGIEKLEITKEEWLANKDESKRLNHQAFMSKLKISYKDYKRRVSKNGWREELTKWLKDDSNFTA